MPDTNTELAEIERLESKLLTTPARRIAFDALLNGFNQIQAAQKAHLSKNYVNNLCRGKAEGLYENCGFNELLTLKRAYLSKTAAERVGLSIERVLREYKRLALADISGAYDEEGNLISIKDMPEDLRRAVSGFETDEAIGKNGDIEVKTKKIRFHDKRQALQDIAKHLNMFTPDAMVDQSVTINVTSYSLDDGQSKQISSHQLDT